MRACISMVLSVRLAITMEMPIDEPILRTSVMIDGAAVAQMPGQRQERRRRDRHEQQAEADALDDAGDDDRVLR